ncbi:MAG TPA: pyridoxal phosphate-dependent aminotransferase [Candidatus Coproplasma avicola]|uniref:Aminotransferase n=1 Tax=Candidatus Coproplasma avicola TaxID=2840744 RepID=A0A9D1J8T2_9FIRM|nr:pyridoxal phosphate-dependent aminotransferase [Candidatus Coproplasma avicola]
MKLTKRVSNIAPSMTLAMSAKSAEMKAAGEKVINFGVGEPDFNTPENIIQAAKDAMDKGYTKYVAAAGLPALKKAVCEKFKRDNNLDYKPSQIVISNGGKHAILNAVAAVVEEGDEVIIPSPYWLTYPEVVRFFGGVPKYVETSRENDFKMTAEQLEAAITPKTVMLIFNSPCNPTGAVYSEEEIKAIAAVCEKHELCVLSDEIYEKLVYDGLKHYSIAEVSPKMKELTILVNGVSKSYAMTGWRLGYLAAAEHVAKAIGSFQSHATSNVNTITQYAALAALEGDQQPMADMVKAFAARRVKMMDILDGYKQFGLDYVKPEGAFYVMLVCDKFYGKSLGDKKIEGSMDFAMELLAAQKVAATPGICFGDDSCIRLSYALSVEEMEEGLERIKAFCLSLK